MYCPRCGSDIWLDDGGAARCPSGAAFSAPVTRALSELQPESPAPDATAPDGTAWHCPVCGRNMVQFEGCPACPACGRRLRMPLFYQLVEFNPHVPYSPKPPPTGGLVAYWITRPGTGHSLGVTGRSAADAIDLATHAGYELTSPCNVAENIRAEDLDPRHVLPNIGPLMVRGVWYPLTAVGAGTSP